jgi:toxin-antitoxin system PIN domain toxin
MILVDVGVWLAATWGRHVHHSVARRWFDEQSDDLLLCRVTQMSLLRLISNPAIMGDDVVTRSEAWRVLDQFWSDSRVLWADEPDQLEAVFRAISARRDNSHKLWTDDYLAAFAQASGAVLATLDTKLKYRYPSVQVDQLMV